jgi:type VI protein secretion system component VasK
MTFLAKAWGLLKKVPGWVWAAILVVLAIVIPAFGWARERRAHKVTKEDRDSQKARAKMMTEVAREEAETRRRVENALSLARVEEARIQGRREEVEAKEDEVSGRVDEHAGDVDQVADDINAELGLE